LLPQVGQYAELLLVAVLLLLLPVAVLVALPTRVPLVYVETELLRPVAAALLVRALLYEPYVFPRACCDEASDAP
jgi:hypothetical protein